MPKLFRFGIGSDSRRRSSIGTGLLRHEWQWGKSAKAPRAASAASSGGCGCIGPVVVTFIAFLVLVFIFGTSDKQLSGETGTGGDASNRAETKLDPKTGNLPVPEAPARNSNETAKTKPILDSVSIPLFADPIKAAKVPILLGLKDISVGKPAWRHAEIGWYGQSEITTFQGGFTKVGDVDNSITCMHSSSNKNEVEFVRWTANLSNPADSGTAARFKEFCMQYVQKLGCPIPVGLFEGVDPVKGQLLETSEATFELKRLTYNIGFGWQFTVTAK